MFSAGTRLQNMILTSMNIYRVKKFYIGSISGRVTPDRVRKYVEAGSHNPLLILFTTGISITRTSESAGSARVGMVDLERVYRFTDAGNGGGRISSRNRHDECTE